MAAIPEKFFEAGHRNRSDLTESNTTHQNIYSMLLKEYRGTRDLDLVLVDLYSTGLSIHVPIGIYDNY